MDWLVFDVEGDGLDATRLYCISWAHSSGAKGTATEAADCARIFERFERSVLVGHNIIRWDIPTIERLLGIDLSTRVLIVDTLATGWVLDPDRERHGLESYGVTFGIEKPHISDWEGLKLEDYVHRCEEDVRINVCVWKSHLEKLEALYDDPQDAISFLRYLQFKMGCARLQEESGWKLDVRAATEELRNLNEERERRQSDLAKVMPNVPTWDTKHPPKRMLKANGQPSELAKRWFDFVEFHGLPRSHVEPIEYIRGYEPPNPGSYSQIKDWLFSIGWKPRTFKYVRDTNTGKMRDVPQISLPNGGGICPSVSDLADDNPDVHVLVGFGALSHRIPVLGGFLRDAKDGRLSAKVAGLTNTLRFKHSEIVNLPKSDKPYAMGIRSSLVTDDGDELCGADMVSLEDRIKQHYIYEHDPKYVQELNRSDYDPHLDIALMANLMTKDEVEWYKYVDGLPEAKRKELSPDDLSDFKALKSLRGIAKNGNYACQYGPPRLVLTCGIDHNLATTLHKSYWKKNWAIREVAKRQKVKTIKVAGVESMWLLNPVSGYWYSLRTEKDIFSTLVQGTAAFVFDMWLRYVLRERPQLTGQFHDEIVLSVKKGFRKQAEDLLNNALKETNDILGLNRQLSIQVQFGNNYADIH